MQRPTGALQGGGLGRMLGLVFFGALVLWVIVTIVAILSPSSGVAKAAGIFGVITFGAFFALLGAFLMERIQSLTGSASAGTPAAGPPGGGRPTSFQG
jgi:hypothetical protein